MPSIEARCLPRFLSDANLPGVEKLAISSLRPDAGIQPSHVVSCEDIGIDARFVPPHGVMMVKGWARSVAAVTVMLAMYENEELREAGPQILATINKKQFNKDKLIHCHGIVELGDARLMSKDDPKRLLLNHKVKGDCFSSHQDLWLHLRNRLRGARTNQARAADHREPGTHSEPNCAACCGSGGGRGESSNQSHFSSGITLSSATLRRKPNAFNLCHQIKLMSKLTGTKEDLEAQPHLSSTVDHQLLFLSLE